MAGDLVLLTGGTGFLGYAILVDLLKSGYRVRVAARSQSKIDKVRAAPSISMLKPPPTQLMFVIVPDMAVSGAYDDAVKGVDFIIHAAARVHNGDAPPSKSELEELFVTPSLQGSLGILRSAMMEGESVRRVVMTSSTVAIAPTEVYTTSTKSPEHEVKRGPETRVAIPAPPYTSELQAYCVGKAAALNAAEAFVKENNTGFDMISIIPSCILGRHELVTDTKNMSANDSSAILIDLLAGGQGMGGVGNAVLCADVARAHVKALEPDIEGNQSFLANTEVEWEDVVPIAKKYFPDAFNSGVFREGGRKPTIPISWDSSKVCDNYHNSRLRLWLISAAIDARYSCH